MCIMQQKSKDFPFDKYFVKKDTNRFDNYSLYALYAAQEAVNHAGLDVETLDKDRFWCYRGLWYWWNQRN